MVYAGDESFYNGAVSSLSPEFGEYFTGFRMGGGQLGFPGSAQTANQLNETVNAIKQGVKAFEVTLADIQDVSQIIPKQHFKEMRALMKLSGVKPSVHGPIIDAAGFGERGWGGEVAREDNERRMFDAIEKTHEIDPSGKIPIVLHTTAGVPGKEYVPGKEGKMEVNKIFAINQETNQLVPFEKEYKFRIEHPELLEGGGKLWNVESQLKSANESEWENKLTDLATFNKHADEIIGNARVYLKDYENAIMDRKTGKVYSYAEPIKDKTGKIIEFDFSKGKIKEELPPLEAGEIGPQRVGHFKKMQDADIFLSNVEMNFANAFHKAYKYGSPKQKEELKDLSEMYYEKMNSLRVDNGTKVPVWLPIQKREILDGAINILSGITSPRALKGPDGKTVKDSNGRTVVDPDYKAPQLFKEVEDFAMGKAVETFGNLAIKSYEKFQGGAPIIAIENMFQGMAFSRAEDLKKIIDDSRQRFENYLIEEKGMKKKDAEKLAEEKIGATWDVGHLNIMKKKGFTDEDILEETKKIRPYVRHIHLTDNFGYSDSHLPPGMGNVPIKKILKELEKSGRFDEMRKIVEAPNFVAQFKKSPHPFVLSAFGSPIYGMKAAPYWNQVQDIVGGYFGGYGTTNPQQHHTIYGAGFTTLPVELGGAMPGTQQQQSRFGGTPMA